MNRYHVVWSIDALDQLALFWTSGKDRSAITQAQDHIDVLLARDPQQLGEPASEGLWRLEVAPLIALYEIDDTGGVVRITGLGRLT